MEANSIGHKVCLGKYGRKVFTIIGIQKPLEFIGGGTTLIIRSGRSHKEVMEDEIRCSSIKPLRKKRKKEKKPWKLKYTWRSQPLS